jgi:hypothetical protein
MRVYTMMRIASGTMKKRTVDEKKNTDCQDWSDIVKQTSNGIPTTS